jgi:hypothetical protein
MCATIEKHGIGSLTSIHMKITMIFISSYTTWCPIGVWMCKEVIIASIETSVGIGGGRDGEAKQKLGNSSAFIAQSILMIKKRTL